MRALLNRLIELHEQGVWSFTAIVAELAVAEAVSLLLGSRPGVGALVVFITMTIHALSLRWTKPYCFPDAKTGERPHPKCPFALVHSENGPTERKHDGSEASGYEGDPRGVLKVG